MNDANGLVEVRAQALVAHYQSTYEVVLTFWRERNRMFVILVFVVATAAAASNLQDPIVGLLDAYLRYQIGSQSLELKQDIAGAYRMLIAFLDVAVFYYMTNLYHRTQTINNNYIYLAKLEGEVRNTLRVAESDVAFTREGAFYNASSTKMTRVIARSYRWLLGLLLLAFFVLRFMEDFSHLKRISDQSATLNKLLLAEGNILIAVDIVVAIFTLRLFRHYCRLSKVGSSAPPRALPKA